MCLYNIFKWYIDQLSDYFLDWLVLFNVSFDNRYQIRNAGIRMA